MFKIRSFSRSATSDRGRRSQASHYVYSTPDDAATVQTAGYFDLAKSMVKKGDLITATVLVDGTPAKLDLVVLDNPLTGSITVGTGAGGGGASTLASGSVRVSTNLGAPGASGSNTALSYRHQDTTSVALTNLMMGFYNGSVDVLRTVANGGQEIAAANVLPIAGSFQTGVVDPQLALQPASGLAVVTWNGAATGVAEKAWKITQPATAGSGDAIQGTATPATQAMFVADGGTISGDGQVLGVPPGYLVVSDPSTANVTAGELYLHAFEMDISGGKVFGNGSISSRTDLGDRRALNAFGRGRSNDWSSGAGYFSGSGVSPCLILGTAANGTVTVALNGDSLTRDNADGDYGTTGISGDAKGAQAWAARACRLAGVPFIKTAVGGDSPIRHHQQGGTAMRRLLNRWCQKQMFNHGANISGYPWAGGIGSGFQATMRWDSLQFRAALKDGDGTTSWAEMFPGYSATTDAAATQAGMTASGGPGTTRWDNFHPFLATGTFNRALGDPDTFFPVSAALYSWAAAQGYQADASAGKAPANGNAIPSAVMADGTHIKGPPHAGVAAIIAPTIKAKLGIAA